MEFDNYTTISILPYLKILMGIIKERIKNKMEQYVSGDKFGFKSGKGLEENQ